MSIEWNVRCSNKHVYERHYDVFSVSGTCGTTNGSTEVGINYLISRMCEWVISESPKKINRYFETVRATWICIDELMAYDRPRATVRAPFRITFLSFYPREQDIYRHDDMFRGDFTLYAPETNNIFSSDREIFAGRLLCKTHECWVRSWKLLEDVMGRPAKRWPVRVWIHQKPERVWDIDANDQLVERPDLAPADERMLQMFPTGPEPFPVTPEESAEVDRLMQMSSDSQMMYLSGLAKEHDQKFPPPHRKPVPLPPWRV